MLDKLLSYVRRHALLRPGDRVGVAVSGGADSVALLRLLLEAREELGIVLSLVHFNHKIRGADAEADEQFVAELARSHDLEFHSDSDDTPAYAREHKLSLEAAGRQLRYAFFDRLTADHTVFRIVTAHTRDDQAETVLLRFLRGAGTKGLAGIYPAVDQDFVIGSGGQKPTAPRGPRIVRPLLEIARGELRAYLGSICQTWREDASNLDVSFARNRLRHEVMPLLRELNPNLDQVLCETAEIARAEEAWWEMQVGPQVPQEPGVYEPQHLRVDVLLSLPRALQRRQVRTMAEHPGIALDFHHVESILALAASEPGRGEKVIDLPRGIEAVRRDRELWFPRRSGCIELRPYALRLQVPGELRVGERKIRASLSSAGSKVVQPAGVYVRAVRLDRALAKSGLVLRNWRAGDRYQPAHTAAPKKLKELLQARHIPRAQKPFWPVVVSGDEIIWVPGFAAPEPVQPRDPEAPALLLEEVPLQPDGEKGP